MHSGRARTADWHVHRTGTYNGLARTADWHRGLARTADLLRKRTDSGPARTLLQGGWGDSADLAASVGGVTGAASVDELLSYDVGVALGTIPSECNFLPTSPLELGLRRPVK